MIVRPDIPDEMVYPTFCPTAFIRDWRALIRRKALKQLHEDCEARNQKVPTIYLDAVREHTFPVPPMLFKDLHTLSVQAGRGYASSPPKEMQPGDTWVSFEVDKPSDDADRRLFTGLTGDHEGPWCIDVTTIMDVIRVHGGIVNHADEKRLNP